MPKVKVRLVAIDLDGTLLDSERQVPEQNRWAVRELVRRDIRVVLASGRMHRTILPFSRQLGLQEPIISYNGGLVIDVETGEMLHHLPVPWELAEELIAWCEARELHLNLYVDDRVFVKERNEWSDLYDRRTGATSEPVGDLHRLRGQAPTKLQIIAPPERIVRVLPHVQAWARGRVIAMHTMAEYIEIVNREVSKGRALTALAQRFGIPLAHTAAFGDASNDRSMLEAAGFGVAMANAADEVKAQANYITLSNDEAGVARAVEKFLL